MDWSFLDVFWAICIFFAWVFFFWLLITVFSDLFRRHDIGGGAKALWTMFVIFLPFLGVFVYLISQGRHMAERDQAQAQAAQANFDSQVRSAAGDGAPAAEIEKAKQLLDSGAITQAEFETLKAKALAASSPRPHPHERGRDMAIGPVQLIVLGFEHPDFHGEIIAELERLRESDTVRVIDALAVHKDAEGEIEVAHLSNLTRDEAIELGSKIGALIGLGDRGRGGPRGGRASPAPRPPPTASAPSTRTRPGTSSRRSPTTPPRRCS